MFRQFRDIRKGEWFIVGGDCSQGGADSNSAAFFSAQYLDFPLEYHARGVAATMTDALFPILEKLYDVTGIQPLVGLEQNNGGISEMERLRILNRLYKYRLYEMRVYGNADGADTTGKLGFATTSSTRPIILGDYKKAFDGKAFKIYYEACIAQHFTFVINKNGKPEGAKGKHDDTIFSHAITWQMFLTEQAGTSNEELPPDDTHLFDGGFY